MSVERQIGEFRTWCTENGVAIGEIFRDEARPGSSVIGRADFLRMMRHFRSGDAPEHGLVVWRFSRFGRNANDRQFYKADLRRLGFTVYSLNDKIPQDRYGKLVEYVLDWKDENFLEELAEDVASGLRNIVATYGAMPGRPPRGFTREPVTVGARRSGEPHVLHRWVPDPTMTGLVRRAFLMLVRGESLRQIHTATGLYGSVNSYLTFFRNPLYKGLLRFRDLIVEDYCEPIVEPEIWERAQHILDARAGRRHLPTEADGLHPRRMASTWLLSGLVYCARCGSPMNGHSINQFDYYACARAKRRHDCTAPKIPAPLLEQAVIARIREYLADPETLAAVQSERLEQYRLGTSELPARRHELETRLANLRRGITHLTAAIADHGHSDALLKQLTALEIQEYECKNELDELERLVASKPVDLTPERITRLAARFEEIMRSGTPIEQRQLLAGWIARVDAERDGRSIVARLQVFVPPNSGPDPPRRRRNPKLVLYPETAWGHLLIDLVCETRIVYKSRGWHVKRAA